MKCNIYKFLIRFLALVLSCVLLSGCSQGVGSGNDFDPPQSNQPTSSNKKRVAITYDDGPHNVRTKKIVDELAKYGYNATFFVVGNRVASVGENNLTYNGAEALKYAASKGNEIGIHGYTHNAYYNTCSNSTYSSEIENTRAAINKVIPGYKVTLMRPIGGAITEERVEDSDYAVIMWSVDSGDWTHKATTDAETTKENIDTIVNNVMSKVSDGSIILMHDLYENTYEATKIILKELHDQGYDVVTVSELLGNTLSAGKKFSSCK